MHRMTSTQARHRRRAVLQSVVDVGAVCAQPRALAPGEWFRKDGEGIGLWRTRSRELLRVCAGCPAMDACRELALRDGDGEAHTDELVCGGMTGQQLARARARQTKRLAAAVAAEWRQLADLTVQLHREAIKNPDKAGGQRGQALAQAAQNTQARELAAKVRQIQSARRARTGWGEAA
ncbi:transcription factor WhiB [Streptomyces flavidovirens]|uniref:Transcription factor WhiB n=1 Tax=Streptomyces flavidovirens TaxID=67298 RepID=A0ABW6RPW6_9ACTN